MGEPATQRPARGLDIMPRHRLLPDGIIPDDLLLPAQVLRFLGHRAGTVLADRGSTGQLHREPVLHGDTMGLRRGCQMGRAKERLVDRVGGHYRTMMSEVIQHKRQVASKHKNRTHYACEPPVLTVAVIRHQSRAFLLLPASFSIAALIAPVFAGWLSDPVTAYPNTFGGVGWLRVYRHSLPSLLSALLLLLTSVTALLTLRETLEDYDPGMQLVALMRIWKWMTCSFGMMNSRGYAPLPLEEQDTPEYERIQLDEKAPTKLPCSEYKLPFHRIWTRNVILTMISLAFFEFHLGAFGSAWPLLLSGTRESSASVDDLHRSLKGGLGLSPQNLGYTMAFAGLAGLLLQFLFYPAVHKEWGTLKCYRLFSLLFPIVYMTSPFLLVMAGSSRTSIEMFTWVFILVLLFIHSTSRIFCVPASIMLLNNCSPHPSVLGIVHGIGQATAAGFRTLGPLVGDIWDSNPRLAGVVSDTRRLRARDTLVWRRHFYDDETSASGRDKV
ncbi:hypothetical protein NPX13_g1483 [Xylaria arbuscula]|uniref:Major facilitator superfamily (MFS) profile domain-containing protein n=1 Tax=Xylaria arbuscula TaxID=114810 RepID=A0A9W8TPL5_9PEZI|nr:hypothetical protein NPX13_g1483 [Xylaria arbuscula]